MVVILGLLAGCSPRSSDSEASTSAPSSAAVATSMAPSPTTSATLPTTTVDDDAGATTTVRPDTPTTVNPGPIGILVYHRTEGFRHQSIEAGIAAFEELGSQGGYEVTPTDDPSVFSPDGLRPFHVIVFLNTTGDVLDEAQQDAMENFISSGRGFVGVHSAADTEYDWAWYGELVGAYFDNHPAPQEATVEFADPGSHPVTTGLPSELVRFDEWYNFRSRPPCRAAILATVDESTYNGGAMGEGHPITWAHEVQGGRAFYTGFGHTSESFEEPAIRSLLDNAVRWAASPVGGGSS
jgi:cytochrome c